MISLNREQGSFRSIAAGSQAAITAINDVNATINVAPGVKHMLLVVGNDELEISLSFPSFPSILFAKNHIKSQ